MGRPIWQQQALINVNVNHSCKSTWTVSIQGMCGVRGPICNTKQTRGRPKEQLASVDVNVQVLLETSCSMNYERLK